MKKTLLIFICFLGCEKVDCDKIVEQYKKEKLWIIFSENLSKQSYHRFKIKGRCKNNLDTIYDEENRYYCEYKKYFETGDTIIKNSGNSIFSIHKKDTVLHFPFECDGKIYK